jgi:NADPH-dependent ferric siderophore reductase
VEERGINRAWIKAAGYWRRGSVGFHENHNEG